MKAVYFARVRECIGKSEETIEPPDGVATVSDLIGWLRARGDNYAAAFDNPAIVRAALDRTHVRHETALGAAREIAFFPPMTGG